MNGTTTPLPHDKLAAVATAQERAIWLWLRELAPVAAAVPVVGFDHDTLKAMAKRFQGDAITLETEARQLRRDYAVPNRENRAKEKEAEAEQVRCWARQLFALAGCQHPAVIVGAPAAEVVK